MSRPRRRPGRGSARRRRVILIYGEDPSDTRALAELIRALAPDSAIQPEPRRQPLVLIKNAPLSEIVDRAHQIKAAVEGERTRFDVVCVFAHEDCDACEPQHEVVARKIEDALAAVGCQAQAIVPAWEIEAWWFLWPEAVKSVVPSWRLPNDYVGRNVGLITNAKEELARAVLRGLPPSSRGRVRPYRGSDSPAVARFVRERGEAGAPQGTSSSYARFRESVRVCTA